LLLDDNNYNQIISSQNKETSTHSNLVVSKISEKKKQNEEFHERKIITFENSANASAECSSL
jgi:hypothetical protein